MFGVPGIRDGRDRGTKMERDARKCRDNWVITIESKNEQHSQIIQAAPRRRSFCETILTETPPDFIFSSSAREIRR